MYKAFIDLRPHKKHNLPCYSKPRISSELLYYRAILRLAALIYPANGRYSTMPEDYTDTIFSHGVERRATYDACIADHELLTQPETSHYTGKT